MREVNLTKRVNCPWCDKGEVLVERTAKTIISTQCPKCRKFYRIDLETLGTERSAACRWVGRKH